MEICMEDYRQAKGYVSLFFGDSYCKNNKFEKKCKKRLTTKNNHGNINKLLRKTTAHDLDN